MTATPLCRTSHDGARPSEKCNARQCYEPGPAIGTTAELKEAAGITELGLVSVSLRNAPIER
jgi:hypothetical protein